MASDIKENTTNANTLEQEAKNKILDNLNRNLNLHQLEKIEAKAIQYCVEIKIPYVSY